MATIQQQTFETLNFNPFQNPDILLNNNVDPDINLFNEESFQKLNGNYYTLEDIKSKLQTQNTNASLHFLFYI